MTSRSAATWDLPPTVDTAVAAAVLDVSCDAAYRAARNGSAPVRIVRLGRSVRWATSDLVALLGYDAVAARLAELGVGPPP